MKYNYPFDPRIHNFGNVGLGGRVHAEFAPLFTKMIDDKAYNGRNIRKEIITDLSNKYEKSDILDLCCGVGFSTSSVGVDTSPQMINKARKLYPGKTFYIGNAENFNCNILFDAVTCMFAFHEMPISAHEKIIENSMNLAIREIQIIDISPQYKSNFIMRTGEPYLIEYQKSIEKTMESYGFKQSTYIKNHVTKWTFENLK
jgi:SAM-dependent methyltransferase